MSYTDATTIHRTKVSSNGRVTCSKFSLVIAIECTNIYSHLSLSALATRAEKVKTISIKLFYHRRLRARASTKPGHCMYSISSKTHAIYAYIYMYPSLRRGESANRVRLDIAGFPFVDPSKVSMLLMYKHTHTHTHVYGFRFRGTRCSRRCAT